jgi:hypothetical protein
MEEGEKASPIRFIALDIHKHYSVVAGVNQRRPKPSSWRTRKAVSERFISRATAYIQVSSLARATQWRTS